MSKKFARVWYILGIVLILIPVPAVLSKFKNYVLFFPCYFGICCLILPRISRFIVKKSRKTYIVVRGIFLTLFFAFIAYFIGVSGIMAHSALISDGGDTPCDILILGSGIDGDQPDIMLRDRLLKAIEYMNENPEVNAVCCGGKSPGKPYSEAEVMKMYLLRHGIDESRIYMDEQSTSTRENIVYARELLDSIEGEGRPLAVCTSDFHVYRAKEFAKKEGLGEIEGLAAKTPFHIFPAFWVREFFGISRMYLLGY